MKKMQLCALCSALLCGLIIGCNKGAENKTLTLSFATHQSGLPTTGIVQELARDFEAETGIKIDFQISPDAQWRDLIRLKLDSGEAADIFCADTPINLASSLHVEQYSLPLTDQEWVNRMDANARSVLTVNNEVYGISFAGKKMCFYIYNKELFERAGASVPTTYAELKEACAKLLALGVTPIYEATANGWHQVLPLFETGGLYLSKDPDLYNKLNTNSTDLDSIPDLLAIIKELKECADLGYFGRDFLSNNTENAKAAIAREEAAMYIAEAAFIQEVKTDFPDFDESKLGIFVLPWGDNQTIGVNPASNAYFINKNSRHIEEAKRFFEFLARPENLQKRLDGSPMYSELCWPEIPSRYSQDIQDFIASYPTAPVMQAAVNYIDNQWFDIGKDLESMYIGALSPEEVLATIMKRRNEQAVLQRDPYWNK